MREIVLTKGFVTIVDDDMFEILSSRSWFCSGGGTGYAKTNSPVRNNKQMAMHHVVVGYPLNGMVVDHLNGNSLDNRKENLRVVTTRQNLLNKKRHRNGVLAGIQFSKNKKARLHPWRSEIYLNKKRYWLGSFSTAMEAHLAYVDALNNGVKI